MTQAYEISHLLAGAMLVTSFALLYQERIAAVLNAFAVVAEPGGVAPEIQRRFGGLIDRVSFYSACDIDAGAWDPILAGLRASRG